MCIFDLRRNEHQSGHVLVRWPMYDSCVLLYFSNHHRTTLRCTGTVVRSFMWKNCCCELLLIHENNLLNLQVVTILRHRKTNYNSAFFRLYLVAAFWDGVSGRPAGMIFIVHFLGVHGCAVFGSAHCMVTIHVFGIIAVPNIPSLSKELA
jgi:hypothetical protein